MTREEALAIVLKAIEHECHFDACPTIERAHEVIRSEKDEGRPLIANPTIKSMLFFDRLAGPTTYYGSENDEDLGIGVEGQPRGDVHYRLTPIYYGSEHVVDASPPDTITFGDLLEYGFQNVNEANLPVENYVVAGRTDTGEILTVNALIAECEAAAAYIREMQADRMAERYQTYTALADRRERLMSPRSPTTADKGEGGGDRAS